MGFLFGKSSWGSGGGYTASEYRKRYGGGYSMPTITTDVSVPAEETPKAAATPDLAEYAASEKRRLAKNGVRGTFTMGAE